MSGRGLGPQAALLATLALVACGGGLRGRFTDGGCRCDPRVQEAMDACSVQGPGPRPAE